MKLNLKGLQNTAEWTSKGYKLPQYDVAAVKAKTIAEPMWMHFGAGNIFRAFTATVHQQLLNTGLCDRGIIVGEAFDEEIIDKAYTPFDNLSLTVTLNSDGNIGKEVVASVVHSVKPSTDMAEMIRIFEAPSLQMASFTITEKGYSVKGADGQYFKWQKRGLVDAGYLAYLKDPKKVSFNWSMIDKITPRPSDTVVKTLQADGFEDTDLIITAKNTYTAAFVNAEPTQYLVIEDWFPNGRPALEKGGVLFTDRETVDKIETMKVTTCLNPLHTVMAIYGCLLNIPTIADIGADPQMKAFIEKVGYVEGMPVVVDPGVLNPMDFIKTVIDVRFPNPYLPDAPQRIATDTSQKIPVRFGVTIKSYLKRGQGEEKNLQFIPLFFAGWLRYLLAVDDQGQAMTLSPDPMLAELQGKLSGVQLGDQGPFDAVLKPILSNATIFGVDLYEVGLAEKVIGYFTELMAGPGAVRKTLIKYLG